MGHAGAFCPKYRTNLKAEIFQSSSLQVFHPVATPFLGLLCGNPLNQDQPRHIQRCSLNLNHAKFQPCTESPRFGPGLHGRGKCEVGCAVVGTAGALPALHQDISAPGTAWEVIYGDLNFLGSNCPNFWIGEALCGGFICRAGQVLPTLCQVNLQRNMMPKLRLLAQMVEDCGRIQWSTTLDDVGKKTMGLRFGHLIF